APAARQQLCPPRDGLRPEMKALVVNALGTGFELESVDIATPIGREVLIDVKASGLCHTDLLFATHSVVPLPAVLGHEVSGIVAEVGPDVTQFKVGDHVVGCLTQTCGTCVHAANRAAPSSASIPKRLCAAPLRGRASA